MKRNLKRLLSRILAAIFRMVNPLGDFYARLKAHALLSAKLKHPVDASVVILGEPEVYGTGDVRLGKDLLLYKGLYFETQEKGKIEIGDCVVMSRGVHIVAREKIVIGEGTMVGEYTSIRDANHLYGQGRDVRSSGYQSDSISIGKNVWIGRGVCVLSGVSIGDNAVIGANAVVTHNVDAFSTVAGVPARRIKG